MSTRAQSINDSEIGSPKIRVDQKRRIREIVRNNSPKVALEIIRDYVKGISAKVTLSDDLSTLKLIVRDTKEKISTEYQFNFNAPEILPVPTL